MALINDLVNRIDDIELRQRIKKEVDKMSKEKKFGLVFEDHLPEFTPLHEIDIKVGNTVALRDSKATATYTVQSIENGVATIIDKITKKTASYPNESLVVVAEFGEPIYPYLEKLDSIENAPGDDLWHILIESDNYHALQLLEYVYTNKVDCIYIDPPYNNRSKEWKYNNDYVDTNDKWRHSKWLSFMKKRLVLAKKMLNQDNSVLIVTIDDNELYTLGLLLEEIFPGADQQIINITINPKGKARKGRLSQVDEYAIILYIGAAESNLISVDSSLKEIRWPYLRRSDVESARGTTKGGVSQFYPIYVDIKTEKIVKIGKALSPEEPLDNIDHVEGAVPVFPIRADGKQMNWGLTGPTLEELNNEGYVRVLPSNDEHHAFNFSYVTTTSVAKVKNNIYEVAGTRPDGTKIVINPEGKAHQATTAWAKTLHDANKYGTQLLGSILTEKKFPFPKSLYSVYDILKVFLLDKPNAIVLDFFAGSGTTGHAVNLLNSLDGGHRQSILVTNNEVSNDEAKELKSKGYLPGDTEWDSLGIARHITWPRIKSAISGKDVDGNPIKDAYIVDAEEPKLVARYIKKIDFTNSSELNTVTKKKGLLSLIDSKKNDLTQTMIKGDTEYITSEEHNTSILFNLNYKDEWIDSLQDMKHIFNFYIVADTRNFNAIKKEIVELLGDYEEYGEARIPMSEGFEANAVFFKLGFLNKDSVALGRQFKEILSVLWLKAGAIGECPNLDGSDLPGYLYFPDNQFAVLLNETHYSKFKNDLNNKSEIETVFIVTNSEKGFSEMSLGLDVTNSYQLYRDYLDNFRINVRRS